MTMKYKNLQAVAAAFASGELDTAKYKLILDNDCSYLVYCGPIPEGLQAGTYEADVWRDEKNDELRNWFWGNGYADLRDACLAAGIPADWC